MLAITPPNAILWRRRDWAVAIKVSMGGRGQMWEVPPHLDAGPLKVGRIEAKDFIYGHLFSYENLVQVMAVPWKAKMDFTSFPHGEGRMCRSLRYLVIILGFSQVRPRCNIPLPVSRPSEAIIGGCQNVRMAGSDQPSQLEGLPSGLDWLPVCRYQIDLLTRWIPASFLLTENSCISLHGHPQSNTGTE